MGEQEQVNALETAVGQVATDLATAQSTLQTELNELQAQVNAGQPVDPAWAHNLRAHPDLDLEVAGAEGVETVAVHAEERQLPVEAEDASGKVIEIFRQENNYQRLFRLLLPFAARRVRLRIDTVRGAGNKRIFSFDLK